MAFNENQIFYACLWWAAHLPGGADYTGEICARYGKPSPVFSPYTAIRKPFKPHQSGQSHVARMFNMLSLTEQMESIIEGRISQDLADEINAPVTQEQVTVFFDVLYSKTKQKITDITQQNAEYASPRIHYIELRHSPATASTYVAFPDYPFSDEIEASIAAANIPRGKLPQRAHIECYSDGQVFIYSNEKEAHKRLGIFDYPGKPALPYERLDIQPSDMDSCPRLSWKTTYRIVPLKKDQPYQQLWMSANGERQVIDAIAKEGEAIFIRPQDFSDPLLFDTLPDEDIIALHPAIKNLYVRTTDKVLAATDYYNMKMRVERTGSPHIIHEYLDHVAYMIVDKPVQLGTASRYSIAQPGDLIIRETENSHPRLIRRELIENGDVSFIFPDKNTPAAGICPPRLH